MPVGSPTKMPMTENKMAVVRRGKKCHSKELLGNLTCGFLVMVGRKRERCIIVACMPVSQDLISKTRAQEAPLIRRDQKTYKPGHYPSIVDHYGGDQNHMVCKSEELVLPF